MTTFFTADLHLNHGNIIKYCNRPFSSAEEMDKTIINNWNAVVGDRDTVYILGDFCLWRGRIKADTYLRRLKGHKILIKGNHDKKDILKATGWDGIHTRGEFNQDGEMIVLDHYAMRTWNKSHHGTWHLYGHTHGRLIGSGRSFDVGVDAWNFRPVSFYEVRDIMQGLDHTSRFDPLTLQEKDDGKQPNQQEVG